MERQTAIGVNVVFIIPQIVVEEDDSLFVQVSLTNIHLFLMSLVRHPRNWSNLTSAPLLCASKSAFNV